ncbi:barstar family protein [Streptomyces sp. NPDC054808]
MTPRQPLTRTATPRPEPFVVFGPSGALRVPAGADGLEAAGGRVHHFDSRELVTEQGIHRAFAEVLQFPGYYGANWDALVDCLSDLCGEVTGGVGIVGVPHDADLILDADHFPLLVSVLCQAADRANASADLDGFPSDRPALSEHFHFEFRDFDPENIALRVRQPDLIVTTGADHVAAALNPEVWH